MADITPAAFMQAFLQTEDEVNARAAIGAIGSSELAALTIDDTILAGANASSEDLAMNGKVTIPNNDGGDPDEALSYLKADARYVNLAGTETITGIKEFSLGLTVNIDGLYTDIINDRIGINTNMPRSALEVKGPSSDQLRLSSNQTGTSYYIMGRNETTGYLDFQGAQIGKVGYVFNDENGTSYFTIDEDGICEIANQLKANSGVNLSGLSEYADDAAAGVGGLVAGDLYTTTGSIKTKL